MIHFRAPGIALSALCVSVLSGGCAKKEPEAQGVIARVNGELKKVESSEQATLCASERCEPNFVYAASFGRRRRQDPPSPPPNPPAPPLPAERHDYSRAILGLEAAWAISEGSREIVVAVVDTGVDFTHPDLAGNIWTNERERSGRPGVDDDGNGYVDDVYGWDFVNNRPNGFDDNKHGTHCAGIIGAEANGIGTIGVNKKVRIMPLKFLAADGRGDSYGAIRAIYYAADNGARVISNSWGGGGYSALLNQAIQYARSKGALVVAAAGNEANDNDAYATYPAGYAGVIAVASTDEADQLSPFSSFGATTVLLAAPGSRIYSTVPGGKFEFLSGTSMATPQVSGALALALSVSPTADETTLVGKLCETSKKILTDRTVCGRLDVAGFLTAVRE